MKILPFKLWESDNKLDWREMEFSTSGEKSVSDVVEETMLGKDLTVIYKGDTLFTKLEQIISTGKSETILEVTGNRLYLYTTPFDIIEWDTIGASPEEILDTCFIILTKNINKV